MSGSLRRKSKATAVYRIRICVDRVQGGSAVRSDEWAGELFNGEIID